MSVCFIDSRKIQLLPVIHLSDCLAYIHFDKEENSFELLIPKNLRVLFRLQHVDIFIKAEILYIFYTQIIIILAKPLSIPLEGEKFLKYIHIFFLYTHIHISYTHTYICVYNEHLQCLVKDFPPKMTLLKQSNLTNLRQHSVLDF